MEINETTFQEELDKIIKEGRKDVFYNIVAKLHFKTKDSSGNEEQKEFEAIKVLEFSNRKNYVDSYHDKIKIKIIISSGIYAKFILPNLKKLEVTVIMKPQVEGSLGYDKEKEIITKTYIALPNIETLDNLDGTDALSAPIETMDLADYSTLELELIDKLIWHLRPVTFGTVLRKTTPEKAIQTILSQQSKVEGLEAEEALLGVDVVKPDNPEEREHFLFPHGTLLSMASTYVQNECGGVYNTYIGQYLHDRYWFVYPLFNTRRASKSERLLNLFKIPETKYVNTERTFRSEDKKHYVLGSLKSKIKDRFDTDFLDQGNGIRFTDSRLIMQDGIEVKNNKAVIKRDKMNYEIIFKKQDNDAGDPKKNISNVFINGDYKIHSNPFAVASSMAQKYGMFYEFNWINADPTILFPGMCVKTHYLDKKNVVLLEGVLHYAFVFFRLKGKGIYANSHQCDILLGIYVNKPLDEKEKGTDDDVAKTVDKWSDYENT